MVEVPISQSLPSSARSTQTSQSAPSQLDGLVVCCIDNEQRILEGMRALLENWGCHVVTGLNKREAEKHFKKTGAPDIILADYHLDEGTGIDAVTQIRWRFGREIPAVLITADRSKPVRDAALAKSIQVLNKPVKPAALRAALSRYVSKRAAAE